VLEREARQGLEEAEGAWRKTGRARLASNGLQATTTGKSLAKKIAAKNK
jgi:hypothetical protein